MKAKKARGRPLLPENERRRHVVMLRLSDDEREAIENAARSTPLATFVREAAVDAARRGKRRGRKGKA